MTPIQMWGLMFLMISMCSIAYTYRPPDPTQPQKLVVQTTFEMLVGVVLKYGLFMAGAFMMFP